MKKSFILLNIFLALLLFFSSGLPQNNARASGSSTLPILFGAYSDASLQTANLGISELSSMNSWLTGHGASGLTFAGDFIDLIGYGNPAWNVPHEFDAAWNAGLVPFMNLDAAQSWEPGFVYGCSTTVEIAAGHCDSQITTFATYFKQWALEGGTRRAFLAPLPEDNGYWTSWSNFGTDTPTDFINAYIRIRSIFHTVLGDPLFRSSIRWVFAPNGASVGPQYNFEYYYPGDDMVDIVGFSSYNYGGCASIYPSWDTFGTSMKPYLDRMQAMAPSKPIFINQTGTTPTAVNPNDPTQTKSAWVHDTFDQLANYPAVRAILYYNVNDIVANIYEGTLGNCGGHTNYQVYDPSTNTGDNGFLTIMQDSTRFGRWAPSSSKWGSVAFVDPSYTFADVMPTHPFSGAPNAYYYNSVLTLYNNGITGGCTTSPLNYCPNQTVTRAQMAIFLERGMNGSSYNPPPPNGSVFTDVPYAYWAAGWVEKLAADGITTGCGAGDFCPNASVTRDQMAIFILRSEHGSSYTPPGATGTMFGDVPASYWAASWIEQLANEGITGGCGAGNYCPLGPVTRAQMAIFLVKAFSLH